MYRESSFFQSEGFSTVHRSKLIEAECPVIVTAQRMQNLRPAFDPSSPEGATGSAAPGMSTPNTHSQSRIKPTTYQSVRVHALPLEHCACLGQHSDEEQHSGKG